MLLTSSNFSEKLFFAIEQAKSSLLIASAFIKIDALKQLIKLNLDLDVTVISRWQKHDIVAGASDLEVYDFCRSNGWRFGISQNFHGKVYVVDQQQIFLGSANFTQRGMHLTSASNIEFGTVMPASQADLGRLENFLQTEIIWLNDMLFEALEQDIKASEKLNLPLSEHGWTDNVKNLLATDINYLWIQQLLFTPPTELLNLDLSNEAHQHDYNLLDLTLDELSKERLRVAFKQSHLYLWAICKLKQERQMNFGAFSFALHNALLDDPAPYRREVKQFVAVLFEWFNLLENGFEIIKYKRTMSIRWRDSDLT